MNRHARRAAEAAARKRETPRCPSCGSTASTWPCLFCGVAVCSDPIVGGSFTCYAEHTAQHVDAGLSTETTQSM